MGETVIVGVQHPSPPSNEELQTGTHALKDHTKIPFSAK